MNNGTRPTTFRWLIALLLIGFCLPGCFLKPKKKSAKKGASNELVDKGSIFMDRVGDGDSALLQFKTFRSAKCKLEFYSQDSSSTPTREKPGTVDCANQDAGKVEFAEKIPGLTTDNLYFVVIVVWDSAAEATAAQRLTIKETANTDTVITDGGEDLKLANVSVARLNVPLKVGEFHRYKFESPLDISDLKQMLVMENGCKAGVPTAAPTLSKSNTEMPIANLATRDFAAGTAGKHPEYPDRLQITYSGVNELMEKWTLLYTEGGKDHSITARPVSRIINLEMQSDTAMAFGEPQLAEAADPLKINDQNALKITWTVGSTLLENTFMTIQIGRAEDPKAIYCAFPASKRSAEVPANLLNGLEDGRHVVLVEMIANQIWLKDSWLITTYDWRSGRIEK
jgi:hypothetical protein